MISPADAIITPMTMKETLPRVLRFGGASPKIQLVMRTATGVVALGRILDLALEFSEHDFLAHLEHLNE